MSKTTNNAKPPQIKSNSGFADWFSGLAVDSLDTLPPLTMAIPNLASSLAAEQGLPPIAVQLLNTGITKGLGWALNWATGTGKSDIRASDLLKNPNDFRINQIIVERKALRAIEGFNTDFIKKDNQDLAKKVLDQVFAGMDPSEYQNGALYNILSSGLTASGRSSVTIAKDVIETLAANRKVVSYNGQPLNFGSLDPDNKAVADAAKEFASKLTESINSMMFGDASGRKAITGSLSRSEVSQVLQSAAERGLISGKDGYDEQLRSYVARIAEGVDNVRGALGRNVSLSEATSYMKTIFGVDVARMSPQAFAAAASGMRQLSGATGIDTSDIFGDQKSGTVGTMQVISAMAKGTGIKQHRIGTMALALAAVSEGQSSGLWDVSDTENMAAVGGRMMEDELSGRNINLAILFHAWAEKNGKDLKNLEAADYRRFISENTIDPGNFMAVQSAVGGADAYSAWRGSEIIKSVSAAITPLYAADMAARDNERREKVANNRLSKKHRDLLSLAGVTDIFSGSKLDIEKKMWVSEKLDVDQKRDLQRRLNLIFTDLWSGYGIAWTRTDTNALEEFDRVKLPAAGVLGLQQYLNRMTRDKKPATGQGIVAAFFGLDPQKEVSPKDLKLTFERARQLEFITADKAAKRDQAALDEVANTISGGTYKTSEEFNKALDSGKKDAIEAAEKKYSQQALIISDQKIKESLPLSNSNSTSNSSQHATNSVNMTEMIAAIRELILNMKNLVAHISTDRAAAEPEGIIITPR